MSQYDAQAAAQACSRTLPLPEPPPRAMTSAAAAPATTRYKAVIGVKIHVQLNTASKMFCGCSTSRVRRPIP